MLVPHAFSPWVNLPFFVAEACLSTACTRHTSRLWIWPKSYILYPKTWEPYLAHFHASTSMTPAYYQLSNSAGFWQQHRVLHLICHCWPFNFSPNSLYCFIINESIFAMLSSISLFPRRSILLQSVFSIQIWFSPSLLSLFLPSPTAEYAALCDPV